METKSVPSPTTPTSKTTNFFLPGSFGEKFVGLVLWSDVVNSTVTLTSGLLFLFLLKFGGYSFLSLVSYLMLLQLVLSFLYVNGMRLWFSYGPLFVAYLPNASVTFQGPSQIPSQNTDLASSNPSSNFSGSEEGEAVQEYVSIESLRVSLLSLANTINPVVGLVVEVARCKSNIKTLKALVLLSVFAAVGQMMDTISFYLLFWLALFTLPNIYFNNKTLIDERIRMLVQQIIVANRALDASLGNKTKTA